MKDNLVSEIVKVSALKDSQVCQMNHLMGQYFDGVTLDSFLADLENKKLVILLSDGEMIKGFSTMDCINEDMDGQKIKAVFSGDTIIDKDYWGTTRLSSTWLKFVFSLIEHFEHEEVRLFWYLISMGYKTYRYLPVYFREFYPRNGVTTPAFEDALINRLSLKRFPRNFDASKGVIRFDGNREKLRSGVADVPERRLMNKDISFFVTRNPGHYKGDELACIAELNMKNIKEKFINLYQNGSEKYKTFIDDFI